MLENVVVMGIVNISLLLQQIIEQKKRLNILNCDYICKLAIFYREIISLTPPTQLGLKCFLYCLFCAVRFWKSTWESQEEMSKHVEWRKHNNADALTIFWLYLQDMFQVR